VFRQWTAFGCIIKVDRAYGDVDISQLTASGDASENPECDLSGGRKLFQPLNLGLEFFAREDGCHLAHVRD